MSNRNLLLALWKVADDSFGIMHGEDKCEYRRLSEGYKKPDSFKFIVDGDSLKLFYHTEQIGEIYVSGDYDSNDNEYFYIKEVWIDPEFRGRGLGRQMYLVLLNHYYRKGLELYKGKHSDDAERIWQSLAKDGWVLKPTGEKSPYRKYLVVKK